LIDLVELCKGLNCSNVIQLINWWNNWWYTNAFTVKIRLLRYVYNSDAVGSVLSRKTEPKCQKPNRTNFWLKLTDFRFSFLFYLLFLKLLFFILNRPIFGFHHFFVTWCLCILLQSMTLSYYVVVGTDTRFSLPNRSKKRKPQF